MEYLNEITQTIPLERPIGRPRRLPSISDQLPPKTIDSLSLIRQQSISSDIFDFNSSQILQRNIDIPSLESKRLKPENQSPSELFHKIGDKSNNVTHNNRKRLSKRRSSRKLGMSFQPNRIGPNRIGSKRIAPETDKSVIKVSWNNLTYFVKRKNMCQCGSFKERFKVILKGLNGSFKSGEMTAVMGPSGAGKSTLLECICGKRTNGVSGDITIQGCDYVKVGFVDQYDHLLDHLTVKESIIFASKLRNYGHQIKHKDMAQNLMERLGLETCENNYTMSCSGGQRKRLSIALELVAKANILILDEPTSGLDSSSCKQTIDAMKALTQQKQPMAVVATIHQPSATIFNMFQQIYILSNNGHCMYHGSPSDLMHFLSRANLSCPKFYNPADYIIEVAAGEFGKQSINLLSHYMKEEQKSRSRSMITNVRNLPQMITETQSKVSQPIIRHIFILTLRSFLITLREPILSILRFSAVIPTAYFVAMLYSSDTGHASGCPPSKIMLYNYDTNKLIEQFESERNKLQENLALCFILLMITIFNSLTPTLLTFPMEMNVFRKEYQNNYYGVFAYFVAKTIADLPFQLIPNIIFILVIYYNTGQINDNPWRIETIILIGFMLGLTGQSHGMMFGAIFMKQALTAVFFGGISMLPLILFCGFFKKISLLPYYLLPFAWTSYFKYALDAILIVVYGMGRCQYEHKLSESTLNVTDLKRPEWLETLTLVLEQQLDGDNTSPSNPDETIMLVFGGKSATVGDNETTSLLLSQFEINDSKSQLWLSIEILIVFVIVIRVITYFVLLHKVRR